MILCSVIIQAYCIMTFTTIFDETWNLTHPRPFPKQKYYSVKWEEEDFYTKKYKGQWILKKYCETDSKTKRIIRENYWKEINERSN